MLVPRGIQAVRTVATQVLRGIFSNTHVMKLADVRSRSQGSRNGFQGPGTALRLLSIPPEASSNARQPLQEGGASPGRKRRAHREGLG